MNRQAEDCPLGFRKGTGGYALHTDRRHKSKQDAAPPAAPRPPESGQLNSIAGAAPLQELFEQLVALVLRQGSGGYVAGRQELLELVAPGMDVLVARLLEPVLRGIEALPPRQHGRQHRVVPLFVPRRLAELFQPREECLDK